MANAWYRLVPEVHVFMTSLNNETKNQLEKEIKGSNIKFHIYPVVQHALVGSAIDTDYNHAQSLHIASMKFIYEKIPDKELYIFCDDDSYIFPNNIYDSAKKFNLSEPHLIGSEYGSPIQLIKFYKPDRVTNYGFIQGGAGTIITRPMMKLITKHNDLCAFSITTDLFPSDIRLAVCIDNIMGGIENILRNFVGQSNGETPYNLFYQSQDDFNYPIGLPLISYHKVRDPLLIDRLFNSSVSIFKDKITKWDNFTMQRIVFPQDNEGRIIEYAFGFAISQNHLNIDSCHAKTMFLPDNEDDPKKYTQEYECGFNITIECNDELDDVEFKGRRNGIEFVLSAKCPKPEPYHNEVSFSYDYTDFDPF